MLLWHDQEPALFDMSGGSMVVTSAERGEEDVKAWPVIPGVQASFDLDGIT